MLPLCFSPLLASELFTIAAVATAAAAATQLSRRILQWHNHVTWWQRHRTTPLGQCQVRCHDNHLPRDHTTNLRSTSLLVQQFAIYSALTVITARIMLDGSYAQCMWVECVLRLAVCCLNSSIRSLLFPSLRYSMWCQLTWKPLLSVRVYTYFTHRRATRIIRDKTDVLGKDRCRDIDVRSGVQHNLVYLSKIPWRFPIRHRGSKS